MPYSSIFLGYQVGPIGERETLFVAYVFKSLESGTNLI